MTARVLSSVPNLKAIASQKRWRLTWDESRQGREQDPWLMQIPCKYGHIYPHGVGMLGAAVDGHRGIATRLQRLGCRMLQDGDGGEANLAFPVELLDDVAAVMKPRRRRSVSPQQRAALATTAASADVESHVLGLAVQGRERASRLKVGHQGHTGPSSTTR